MKQELLVPYGLDYGGSPIHASQAARGEVYTCPQCNEVLTLRAGGKNVHHFAHSADTACDGESLLHTTAKLLIAKVIRDQIDAPAIAPSIYLGCQCDCCKAPMERELKPGTFSAVDVEEASGDFRVDVMGYRGSNAALAIEVVVTNSVGAKKARELTVPWIELDAQRVISDPLKWQPTNARLKPMLCTTCKRRLSQLSNVANRWGQPLETYSGYLDPSRAVYLAAIRVCWSCHEKVVVYWWPGVPFCEMKPPETRPPTIKNRWSRTYGGRYWANCCPNCDQMDGDNFLFLDLDGTSPFKNLPLRETEEMSERRDETFAETINFMLRNI